jgi:hypothetical protein
MLDWSWPYEKFPTVAAPAPSAATPAPTATAAVATANPIRRTL